MYNKVIRDNSLQKVLHIDLLCNAGPYWQRQLASMSNIYIFADADRPQDIVDALNLRPSHIVFGGGFWNSKVFNKKCDSIVNHLRDNHTCITWSYWGDGTMSHVRSPVSSIFIDAIFCSSENAVQGFQNLGFHAEYAPHPVETELYYKDDTVSKIYDWSFVGTNYGTTRQRQVDLLKQLPYSHLVRGPGHDPKITYATFEETASIMRQSKITININDDNYTNLDKYFSDRIPMAMCCNSMVLTTAQPGLDSMFERGVHIDWFNSDEELIEKINYYLNNESMISQISNNGYNKVINEYSIQKMVPNFFAIAKEMHKKVKHKR